MAIIESSKACTYNKLYIEKSLEHSAQILSSWPAWKIDSMRDREASQNQTRDQRLVHAR